MYVCTYSYSLETQKFNTNWTQLSLEEYLQELAGIHPQQLKNIAERENSNGNNNGQPGTITADDDVPNFAHAALILQNSSNVYSRKVEYLYSLVYKALDEFFQASKNASSSLSSNSRNGKRKSKTVDADVDEFFDFDPHECFLLLDDVVPEDLTPTHRKINLKETEDDEANIFTLNRMSVGGGGGAHGSANNRSQNNNNNVTRLSLGGLSVTRMERNNTSNGGFSSSSSQQQQRALLGILNNGKKKRRILHC